MKILVLFLSVFAITSCFAQTAAAPSDPALTQILPGILLPTKLSKSLDAKKAKAGDKLDFKTTMDMLSNGKVVIPRDSKIEGHVTSAKPHSKDSPDSEIGIAFDRILIKNGRELPIKAAIQAIAPPLIISVDAPGTPAGIGGAPPGQQSGNVGSAEAPGTAMTSSPQIASMAAPRSAPQTGPGGALTSASRGAINMKGDVLSATKETNVISSSTQNVHLDGGMQLMLKTE